VRLNAIIGCPSCVCQMPSLQGCGHVVPCWLFGLLLVKSMGLLAGSSDVLPCGIMSGYTPGRPTRDVAYSCSLCSIFCNCLVFETGTDSQGAHSLARRQRPKCTTAQGTPGRPSSTGTGPNLIDTAVAEPCSMMTKWCSSCPAHACRVPQHMQHNELVETVCLLLDDEQDM
jgi:hypothetical protein